MQRVTLNIELPFLSLSYKSLLHNFLTLYFKNFPITFIKTLLRSYLNQSNLLSGGLYPPSQKHGPHVLQVSSSWKVVK